MWTLYDRKDCIPKKSGPKTGETMNHLGLLRKIAMDADANVLMSLVNKHGIEAQKTFGQRSKK